MTDDSDFELPTMRVADYEIISGFQIGDIDSFEKVQEAIAILTAQIGALHERIAEKRRAGNATAVAKAVGLLRLKETALDFAYGIRREMKPTEPRRERDKQMHRLVHLMRERLPETYRDLVAVFNATVTDIAPIELEAEG